MRVDAVPPTVTAVTLLGPSSGDSTSATFKVAFSEPVLGFGAANLVLSKTGSITGTIGTVSADGTVIVENIGGFGTLRLDVLANHGITDAATNPLTTGYTSGSIYSSTVVTAPAAPSRPTATAVGNGSVRVVVPAPAENGSPITSYTVTASPGGITASGSTNSIVVSGLTNGTPYTFTATATNAVGTSPSSANSGAATPKGNQTITFDNPGTQAVGGTLILSATASSGLAPTYTTAAGTICRLQGGTVNFLRAGSCTVRAAQAGNTAYSAATPVSQTFVVATVPAPPEIVHTGAGDGQVDVYFDYPTDTGASPITSYTVTSNDGIIASGEFSPVSVFGLVNGQSYTFTVTATNAAGASQASAVSSPVIPKASNFVTFANPGTQDLGTTPTLVATATSGLPVTFEAKTPIVCTVTPGGVLTLKTAGLCSINAGQNGNAVTQQAHEINWTFSVRVAIPGAPTIGPVVPTDSAATISFSAPASNGGAAISTYTVTASPGGASASGSSSPITVSGLDNGTAYTFTVMAQNSVGTGVPSAASNAVTPRRQQTVTFANPGAQSFGTSPTLTATASSGLVPIFTSATPGFCTVTTDGALSLLAAGSCTVNADQIGDDATIAAATVSQTFTINGVFPAAPSIGSAVAEDGQAKVSFAAPTSTGGLPILRYTVTSNPGSFIATGSGSPITVTGLDNAAAYTFTVSAENAVGVGPASAATDLVRFLDPPQAANASVTVPANAAAARITPALTGGAAASLAVATRSVHGALAIDGMDFLYTPTPGYSGADSFTYTATNAAGQSTAEITITVEAPTLAVTPAHGSLPEATVGSDYAQAFSTSNGTGPYTYALADGTTLPQGLALSGDTISGRPTTAGNTDFAVSTTDIYGATFTVSYSITVKVPAAIFAFTPASGALPAAMAGESYSSSVTATGGTDPLLYRISAGTLPPGLVLNVSTGALTGPLAEQTQGDYGFTVEVRDANRSTGTASYSLHVIDRTVSAAPDKVVDVPAGATPASVDLTAGTTGGPFTNAIVVSVSPANAGTATIVLGEFAQVGGAVPAGWYLRFTPNKAFSGQARVTYRLVSALGGTEGIVVYNLGYVPEEIATQVDGLVRGFLDTRQGLIASTIKVPGLLARRGMSAASGPFSSALSPSGDGIVLNFSTSTAQMESAAAAIEGLENVPSSPLNFWVDGSYAVHNRPENDNRWGSFGMVSAGVDYLLSEKALLGMSVHLDRMTDPTRGGAEISGTGWLAGPYASFEVLEGVFWDTSLLYGGSSNTIDTDLWDGTFETRRWLLDTALSGEIDLGEATTLTPQLRAVYQSETVSGYTVVNGSGDVLAIEGFSKEQLRVSLGATLAKNFVLDDGAILTPKVEATAGINGMDGDLFGSVSAGLVYQTEYGFTVDGKVFLTFDGSRQAATGGHIGIKGRF